MTIFISHSSRDHAAVRSLIQNLQAAHESVWLDQSLIGGEEWWQRILHQIRSCTVFLVALSNSCLQSKPCRAEIEYAKALGLPILPVLIGDVDSYRIDPIFTVQSVDFRDADVAAGAALIAAVRERAAERKELPDPLPAPPPVPYEYLQRLGAAIDSPQELSPTEQATILSDLRHALRLEDDEGVRGDIHRLLRALRRRSEVTHGNVNEIDDLLRLYPATGGAPSSPELGLEAAHLAGGQGGRADSRWPMAGPPVMPGPPGLTKPRSPLGNKALWIGAAAVVLVAVIAVVAVLVFGHSSHGSANTATTVPTTTSPPPLVAGAMDGLLLSPNQVNTAVGASTIKLNQTLTVLADSSAHIADSDCIVMNFPAQAQVYTGSGWSAVHGQELADAADINHDNYLVEQYLVLFPSAGQAASFFTKSTARWPACSNRQYTYNDPQGVWDVGPVSNTGGMLSVTRTQEDVGGWACQRALTVRNNVAIDTMVCSYNPADAAVKIAQQIADNVVRR